MKEFVAHAQLVLNMEVTKFQKTSFNKFWTKNKKISILRASEIMSRWVKNCSDHLLSDPELSMLKKGLNFEVTLHRVPVVEIVTAIESDCRSLDSCDTDELKAKVVKLLDR